MHKAQKSIATKLYMSYKVSGFTYNELSAWAKVSATHIKHIMYHTKGGSPGVLLDIMSVLPIDLNQTERRWLGL